MAVYFKASCIRLFAMRSSLDMQCNERILINFQFSFLHCCFNVLIIKLLEFRP